MIKILATADLHLRVNEHFGNRIVDGMNDRLRDKFYMLSNMVKMAIEERVDYFFILGDLFDYINPPEVLRYNFFKTIAPLFEEGIKGLNLSGNHGTEDWTYYNLMSETLIANISGRRYFKTINTPCDLMLVGSQSPKGVPVCILPEGRKFEIQKAIMESNSKYAFGHLSLFGSTLQAGINTYRLAVADYKVEDFSKFDKVFLGDIHREQQIGDNCYYVGSPFYISLSEIFDVKRLLLINLPTEPTELLEIKNVLLKDTLHFQRTKIDIGNVDIEFPKCESEKSILLVEVVGSKTQLRSSSLDFQEVKKRLKLLGFYDVLFDFKVSDDRQSVKGDFSTISDGDLIKHSIESFCADKKVTSNVLETGLSFLENAYEVKAAENN